MYMPNIVSYDPQLKSWSCQFTC